MRRTRLSLPSMLASRTCVLSRLSIGMACLLRAPSTLAVCDNLAPASGETATCNANAPNPSTLPVVAVAGSTGVTVLMLPGAGISVNNSSGIVIRDSSTVQNFGTIQNTADSFDGITSAGSASGFGHNSVTNGGSIHTAGAASEGIYNGSAAVTMVNTASGVIGTKRDGVGGHARLVRSRRRQADQPWLAYHVRRRLLWHGRRNFWRRARQRRHDYNHRRSVVWSVRERGRPDQATQR